MLDSLTQWNSTDAESVSQISLDQPLSRSQLSAYDHLSKGYHHGVCGRVQFALMRAGWLSWNNGIPFR
ncbi:hypothetical protein PCAR4_140172 [Paraburkholderia caribensis]|nr:hypothetical protein PCAR4_140172 [Paraburkholderia caribensis]